MKMLCNYDLLVDCTFIDDFWGNDDFTLSLSFDNSEKQYFYENEQEFLLDVCQKIVDKYDKHSSYDNHKFVFKMVLGNEVVTKEYYI